MEPIHLYAFATLSNAGPNELMRQIELDYARRQHRADARSQRRRRLAQPT